MPKQQPEATPEWPHVSDAVQVRQDDGSWVFLTRPDSTPAVEPAPTTEETP